LVQLELLGNKLAERLRQRKLAQAELDRHLPQTRNAQQTMVRGRLYQRLGFAAEARITSNEPKKRVRIQQQLHRV
jgi:hypothetical protein